MEKKVKTDYISETTIQQDCENTHRQPMDLQLTTPGVYGPSINGQILPTT